jgi:hypothetical protein
MVKTWWLRGKSWFLNGGILASKTGHFFENIFVANQ